MSNPWDYGPGNVGDSSMSFSDILNGGVSAIKQIVQAGNDVKAALGSSSVATNSRQDTAPAKPVVPVWGVADRGGSDLQGVQGMKTAPITVTEMAVIGGVLVLGYMAYRAYSALSGVSISGVVSDIAQAGATAVDVRTPAQNPNEFGLGGVQQAVSNAVQRGQDAGATNFFSAYLLGLTK